MSRRKRDRGEGSIQARGKNSWRIRYRVPGEGRQEITVVGSKVDAQKKLRDLLHSADDGSHVPADRLTVGQWVEAWIDSGCPGNRKRGKITQRTIERYAQLLRTHIIPKAEGRLTLKDRPLQQLKAAEIDKLYKHIVEHVSERTARHVHSAFNACLGRAVRTRILARSPMIELTTIPSPQEADHGLCLDAEEMRTLVKRFQGSSLFEMVGTGVGTGARRGEILALFVTDYDPVAKTLKIERAVEETKKFGLTLKVPKTKRGTRTITIDDDLCAMFDRQIDKLKRLAAGIPDGVEVDLSLVSLPKGCLMFPNPPAPGQPFSFTALRNPRNFSKEFQRKATALGFPGLGFHDLRGSHSTLLLDNGQPPHVVAARIGDDPGTLMRHYAKLTKKADTGAAEKIGTLLKGMIPK
jgi:integrase